MKLPAGLCAVGGNSAEGTENGGRCPIWGDGIGAWGVDGPEGKDAYASTLATAVFAGTALEELTPCSGAARGPKGGGNDRAVCPMLFGPCGGWCPEKPVETVLGGAKGRSGSDPEGMLLGTC